MQLRRARIICTIGPATQSTDMLVKLIEAGMDVARLNFSHGTHEDHAVTFQNIREAAKLTGKPIAVMQDLQGPKIRTGKVENGAVPLVDGQRFVITVDDLEIGNSERVGTPYKDLTADVRHGMTVLLDDGYIILHVESLEGDDIVTRVVKGGILKNNKGIIIPGAKMSANALNPKDVEDVKFGLSLGVDAVALSFVCSERDILELKTTMKLLGRTVPIIAKIERNEGIEDIEDIISESSGIMVARGDLGLEMPAEDVPLLQKSIIKRCNFYGVPVITATQMLESMIENPRPTRAEASDVANAVLDGTDCVMLSGETSVGKYPLEAVGYMNRIIRNVEKSALPPAPIYDIPKEARQNVADAIGRACRGVAEQVNAVAIVTLTTSGNTARNIAKYRPAIPVIALTDNEDTLRQLAFVWGVTPVHFIPHYDTEERLKAIAEKVIETGLATRGDYVVLTAGMPLQKRFTTNMLRVILL